MNKNVLRLIGLGVSMIGFAATALSNWVDDKKMQNEVREEVDRALTQREKKDGES